MSPLMGVVVFWIVMALVVAVIAGTKGRNGFGWFFYGLAIWPVALAHVAFVRRLDGPDARHATKKSPPSLPGVDQARAFDDLIAAANKRGWEIVPAQSGFWTARKQGTVKTFDSTSALKIWLRESAR